MHRPSVGVWITAAALSLAAPWAYAAGLGKLTVTSALGQPFAAQIELVSVQREELNSLAARLGSAEAYRQANLQYPAALTSLRFTVESRPGGQHYLKVTSTRPVDEPVVDLLVELVWASGRIARAYTALIDPPGYPQSAPTDATATVQTRPAAPPSAAVEAKPVAPPRQPVAAAPSASAAGQYGPIRRGETLAGVAATVKPDGVTLEQMLVGLYRSNPEAFMNNMNRMKTGRILRVPGKEEIANVAPAEASQEVRVQARDWNTYRQRLADAAAPAQERSAASGRITARADDQAAGAAPKDVVRLSKGDVAGAPGGGKGAASASDRLKALEEESVAREKALTEANERIAQLEKTIREQQRLIELKGAPLGAQPPAKPEAAKADATPKPEAAKAEATAKPEAATPTPAPAAAPPAEAPKPEAPAARKEEPPAPKPKVVPPPEPVSPAFVDMVFDEPLYLAAGGGLVLLAVLAFLAVRRRRGSAAAQERVAIEPLGERAAPVFTPAADSLDATPRAPLVELPVPPADMGAVGEDVDALAEAEVYIAYGRDAQAETILREALDKKPQRTDVALKLLDIYAARKDAAAFKEVARRIHTQTGGTGEAWVRAAAIGRALDPGELLYGPAAPAPQSEPPAPTAEPPAPAAMAIPQSTTIDPLPPAPPAVEPGDETISLPPLERPPAAELPALEPDFKLDITPVEKVPPSADDSNVIDFNLDLPKADEKPAPPLKSVSEPAPGAASSTDSGLDFKLDFGDINLNLDGETTAPGGAVKDPHWHDVQQKFDLAKAYQEMGDKDGAREVLQEVLGEGDAAQQAKAKELLQALA